MRRDKAAVAVSTFLQGGSMRHTGQIVVGNIPPSQDDCIAKAVATEKEEDHGKENLVEA